MDWNFIPGDDGEDRERQNKHAGTQSTNENILPSNRCHPLKKTNRAIWNRKFKKQSFLLSKIFFKRRLKYLILNDFLVRLLCPSTCCQGSARRDGPAFSTGRSGRRCPLTSRALFSAAVRPPARPCLPCPRSTVGRPSHRASLLLLSALLSSVKRNNNFDENALMKMALKHT